MDGETPKAKDPSLQEGNEEENDLVKPDDIVPVADDGTDNFNDDSKAGPTKPSKRRSKVSIHSKTSAPSFNRSAVQDQNQANANSPKALEEKLSQPTVGDKRSGKRSDEGEIVGKQKKKADEAGPPDDSNLEGCAPPCVTLPCNIGGNGIMNLVSNFPCGSYFQGRVLLNKRNPFQHNPPVPEESRGRVSHPSALVDYIINLREDLADFQECHGLPRSRDYSFVSLGLALAQESIRAILSIICIFTELFPILAILSLILRFALDKLIDILQTHDPSVKMKKIVIFTIEMLMILIPLWLLVGIIFMPLITLIFSVFRGLFQFKDSDSCPGRAKPKPRPKPDGCPRD